MSFPSARSFVEQGHSPEDALLEAFKVDTPDGWAYLQGLVDAWHTRAEDAVAHVRDFISCQGCASNILRAEWLPSGGLKVDVDPDSKLGKQVMRLLGTDVARQLVEQRFGMSFALANCCGGITGDDKKKTVFSPADQVRWQYAIDC